MFIFKGAKNVDDKRHVRATLAVSCTGEFSPIQLIYAGKTERSLKLTGPGPEISVHSGVTLFIFFL